MHSSSRRSETAGKKKQKTKKKQLYTKRMKQTRILVKNAEQKCKTK